MASGSASDELDLSTLLTPSGLAKALDADYKRCYAEELNVMWYHGNMSRACAEKLLFEALELSPDKNLDGMFLVRGVSGSKKDYSLSFVHHRRCYHFYIHCMDEDYFCITEGPKVHGLDMLIEHYIEDANHLPTRLTNLCKGSLPPARVRRRGTTNLLHKVVAEGRGDIVAKILEHPMCPDVNAKNDDGCTALHTAASANHAETVSLLLRFGADTTIRDPDGATPLFRACMNNSLKAVDPLIRHDPGCMLEKSSVSGWLPIHAAAMSGYTSCVKHLLEAGGPRLPRDLKNETPVDLAEKFRRNQCQEFLEDYQETLTVQWAENQWFYPEVDRGGAEQVFSQSSQIAGMFLVRKSTSVEGQMVLNVFDGVILFHYTIHTMTYRGRMMFYMDDGPLHRSLPLLLQHYHRFEDGLVTKLSMPVSSTGQEVSPPGLQHEYSTCSSDNATQQGPDVSEDDPPGQDYYQYSSCPSYSASQAHSGTQGPPTPAGKFKPKLPPRPPDLDSPPSETPPSSPQAKTPPTDPLEYNLTKKPLVEIARKDLKLGPELGKGEYGSVLRGTLVVKKKFLVKPTKVQVAIKMFHSLENPKDFEQEAHVMQQLNHEYIVQLKGICHDKCLMLVEEFVPMGSMLDFLEKNPEKVRVRQELYLWAAQIACGMAYLESQRLVHRDLAARNILLASLQKVKISDFGLSRAMSTDKEYYKASKGGRWPIKWYAPESTNYGHFSQASDVWSYGVTLWEMFSYGSAPYKDMSGVEVIRFIEDGNRLERPVHCPEMVYQTMLNCWSLDPQQRPTFSQLDRHFRTDDEYMSTRELMRAVSQL